MSNMKPSLTKYADTLRVFTELDNLTSHAVGLSPDTVTKISHVAHAVRHAEDSAMANREVKMNEGGTNAWQAANAEPFVRAARQAKAVLEDEGFVKELANSSIPVENPKDHRAVSRSSDYASMTQSFSLIKKVTDLSTLLEREETAKGHPLQERDLGRYCLDPGKSPLVPARF